jgi:hypothetical protein
MLHITNGDSTVEGIQQSGITGEVIPWRDVLHEGPVPAELSLDQLREVRARYLAKSGWSSYSDVAEKFTQRDNTLARFREFDEVMLWFEHDLYDQLQLIQLLDWFSGQDFGQTRVSLICINSFPGRPNFHGLGELSPEQIATLFPNRHEISSAELALGRSAWAAFRSPDPTAIQGLINGDTTALPFLKAALIRHLEQFPSLENGLSRTESQILDAVKIGSYTPEDIFLASQRHEESPFMGDSTVWYYVDRLAGGRAPLLFETKNGYDLTKHGRNVLMGRADYVRGSGIDRWLGGVHLQGNESEWRWDARIKRLVTT